MKKAALIHLSELLTHTSRRFEEDEDYSFSADGFLDDPAFAAPNEIHRPKTDHKDTVFALADSIVAELEGEEVEEVEKEPYWEGENLEVHVGTGSFHFYADGEKVYSHSKSSLNTKRTEFLVRMVRGESMSEAVDQVYDKRASASQAKTDIQVMLEDGKMLPEYAEDLESFISREFGSSFIYAR